MKKRALLLALGVSLSAGATDFLKDYRRLERPGTEAFGQLKKSVEALSEQEVETLLNSDISLVQARNLLNARSLSGKREERFLWFLKMSGRKNLNKKKSSI